MLFQREETTVARKISKQMNKELKETVFVVSSRLDGIKPLFYVCFRGRYTSVTVLATTIDNSIAIFVDFSRTADNV